MDTVCATGGGTLVAAVDTKGDCGKNVGTLVAVL